MQFCYYVSHVSIIIFIIYFINMVLIYYKIISVNLRIQIYNILIKIDRIINHQLQEYRAKMSQIHQNILSSAKEHNNDKSYAQIIMSIDQHNKNIIDDFVKQNQHYTRSGYNIYKQAHAKTTNNTLLKNYTNHVYNEYDIQNPFKSLDNLNVPVNLPQPFSSVYLDQNNLQSKTNKLMKIPNITLKNNKGIYLNRNKRQIKLMRKSNSQHSNSFISKQFLPASPSYSSIPDGTSLTNFKNSNNGIYINNKQRQRQMSGNYQIQINKSYNSITPIKGIKVVTLKKSIDEQKNNKNRTATTLNCNSSTNKNKNSLGSPVINYDQYLEHSKHSWNAHVSVHSRSQQAFASNFQQKCRHFHYRNKTGITTYQKLNVIQEQYIKRVRDHITNQQIHHYLDSYNQLEKPKLQSRCKPEAQIQTKQQEIYVSEFNCTSPLSQKNMNVEVSQSYSNQNQRYSNKRLTQIEQLQQRESYAHKFLSSGTSYLGRKSLCSSNFINLLPQTNLQYDFMSIKSINQQLLVCPLCQQKITCSKIQWQHKQVSYFQKCQILIRNHQKSCIELTKLYSLSVQQLNQYIQWKINQHLVNISSILSHSSCNNNEYQRQHNEKGTNSRKKQLCQIMNQCQSQIIKCIWFQQIKDKLVQLHSLALQQLSNISDD